MTTHAASLDWATIPTTIAKAASPEPLRGGTDKPLLWDIFCRVIDNYGDIGVCWRLATGLSLRGHSVRLWLDDKHPLTWMAPGAVQGNWPRITLCDWPTDDVTSHGVPLSDVWIEAFGCEIPSAWVQTQVLAANAQARRPAWINLEYLSAEPFAVRSHGLPSPVLHGPATGWFKYFFFPGFSPISGGLLPPSVINADTPGWDDPAIASFAPQAPQEQSILLFSYATAPISALFQALLQGSQPVQVLVAAGQTTQAAHRALLALPQAFEADPSAGDLAAPAQEWRRGPLRVRFLPYLPQTSFDRLLRVCDLNLVRGEDSIAQAVQAGKPCIWQIYPQDDGAHEAKLLAYLDAIGADAALRAWHGFWNSGPVMAHAPPACAWPWEVASPWKQSADKLAARLAQNPDACRQLMEWALRGAPP